MLAPPRRFSQLATSFIASGSQGIHHVPFPTSSFSIPCYVRRSPPYLARSLFPLFATAPFHAPRSRHGCRRMPSLACTTCHRTIAARTPYKARRQSGEQRARTARNLPAGLLPGRHPPPMGNRQHAQYGKGCSPPRCTAGPAQKHGTARGNAPERRCSSRTFRYGYLVTT